MVLGSADIELRVLMDSIAACIGAVLMLSLVVVLLILSVLVRALHAKE